MDAGFLNVVEIGQYFMTKDTAEFSQFTDSVACPEYTLPRDEETSEPKGWTRGNTMFGPVLAVTTCCLQGKYGVEIRIKSMNKGNSHSWVRISHGFNKLVTNLNNEQETSEMRFEEYALKFNAGDFACRSKAKAKPQKRDSASSSTRTILIRERTWTDVEPGEYSISDFEVSKKLIRLLRHGSLPREDDGAIELWRIKDNLQKLSLYCHHWSDDKWKSSMAGGGGNKKIFHQEIKILVVAPLFFLVVAHLFVLLVVALPFFGREVVALLFFFWLWRPFLFFFNFKSKVSKNPVSVFSF